MTTQTIIETTGQPTQATLAAQDAHNAKMLAAGNDVQLTTVDNSLDGTRVVSTNASAEGKPAYVPDKFWDAVTKTVNYEALAKSYTELEKKSSQAPKEPTQEQQQAAPQEQQQGAPQEQPQGQQSAVDAAAAEFAKEGKLTDATYEALGKAGLSKQVVDNYIAGQVAQQALIESTVYSEAGGKEAYGEISAWAGQNLTDAELNAFNSALSSPDTAKTAMANLKMQYQQKANMEPQASVGGKPAVAGGDMFRSSAEMQAAMSDPRYLKNDTAFHADVQRKMTNSIAAGIDVFNR